MARRRRLFGPLFYSTLALALIFLVGLGAWWAKPSLTRVWIMWTLSRRMGDSDSGVRTAAAKALGNHGKEARSWLGWVARNGNTEARLVACKTLAHPAQSAVGVIPDLLGALHDVDPRVRRAAAESLHAVWLQVGGACDDQMKDRAIEAIRAGIKDPAWDVRRAALWARDVMDSTKKAGVADVEYATHDGDPRVRAAAALSFFDLAPHDLNAIAALQQMIGDPAPCGDDFVQHNHMKTVAVQQMMMSAGESAVLETLVPLMTHPDAETRSNAIRFLPTSVRPLEPVHAALRRALRDSDARVRGEAARMLLTSPDQQVSEEIVAALQAAVESPVENLYELMWLDQYLAALRSVAPGSERRAVRSMVEAMDRLGRYEQRIMVDLLGKIGPDAEAAVPKLVELSKSSDDRVAASAELALGRILSEPSSQ
jgi:HEAT repeat protein